jgi:hypothetical protein
MSALVVPLLLVLHAGPPTLVSPPWKTVQVPAELAEFYADHLAQALRREGFKVVTASEVSALLSLERQKALLGCTEEASSCIAELGAAMGADAVLMVNLARLEDLYRGNVKLIAVKDNLVIAETSVEASGQKGLLGALDDGARRLADATPGVRAKPAGTKRLWWVPALAGAAGAVVGTVGLVSANVQYAALSEELRKNGVTDGARTMASAGTTTQTVGWVGVGVAVAGLAGMGAVLLFGTDSPVSATVSVSPVGSSVVIGGTF